MVHRTMPENPAEQSAVKLEVIDISLELLSSLDIFAALEAFKPVGEAGGIATEFIRSYAQFMQELVDHDIHAKLNRTDIEIRDLISHVNIMMKKKYEIPFTAMAMHSPAHYRNIHKTRISAAHSKNEDTTP